MSTTSRSRSWHRRQERGTVAVNGDVRNDFQDLFDSKARNMADTSALPRDFFNDVYRLQSIARDFSMGDDEEEVQHFQPIVPDPGRVEKKRAVESDLEIQIRLLRSVRELEEKLAKAKAALSGAMRTPTDSKQSLDGADETSKSKKPFALTRDDYIGLVDLYYHRQRNRFTPEGPDYSPSLTFLENYDLEVPEISSWPKADRTADQQKPMEKVRKAEEDLYESPLKDIQKILLRNQRREIHTMQEFVDLLLDDRSSNQALFDAYKRFPPPGVSWLPKGVQRLFLHRMSTPAKKSVKTMVRYLSLIDDMQLAKLPVTVAEWSSAIYLAGRSFKQVTTAALDAAIVQWRNMEQDAGVRSTHVTFNILFDIAVRAGKFALAESFLKEMFSRGLRLNRLGRVSLIYYHGLRGDGDAVRRTYRDFVEAGEIVDTLVLNCVIAALLNAGESAAADQIFGRMKDLQSRLQTGKRPDGSETFYMKYPEPSTGMIGREMASNSLGRILQQAPHLQRLMPQHHTHLQDMMPLRPDHVTFRALVSYHANVTADLDRVIVLFKEMTEDYNLPLRPIFYSLLFKGFALHGKSGSETGRWNFKQLETAWKMCRNALKDALAARQAAREAAREAVSQTPSSEELGLELPKTAVLNTLDPKMRSDEMVSTLTKARGWKEIVRNITLKPGEQRKPIERVHAQLFDNEPANSLFENNFFPGETPNMNKTQDQVYALGEKLEVDYEEGEYVLPTPSRTITHLPLEGNEPDLDLQKQLQFRRQRGHVKDGGEEADGDQDRRHDESDARTSLTNSNGSLQQAIENGPDDYQHYDPQVHLVATFPMVSWLLRAYTQCTGSRVVVEEIWGAVRKVYRPRDEDELARIVRVVQRCLRHCDKYSRYML